MALSLGLSSLGAYAGALPLGHCSSIRKKVFIGLQCSTPWPPKSKTSVAFFLSAENAKMKMISSKILVFVQKILHSLNTFPRSEAFCVGEGWRPILEKKISRNYLAVPLSVKKESRENSLFVQTMNPLFSRKTCEKAFFIKIMYIQSFKKHWSEKAKMFA